jgi:hypothetical protein
MPKVVTAASTFECVHKAPVPASGADLLRVESSGVITKKAAEAATIATCSNTGSGISPCKKVSVTAGASTLLRVDGEAVLLAAMTATTDSSPPGTASVTDAKQSLLQAEG